MQCSLVAVVIVENKLISVQREMEVILLCTISVSIALATTD
jgi:hypothetical protein